MSKTTLGLITIVLAALIIWLAFFYIPGLKSLAEAENAKLRQANKELDSAYQVKQKILDSLAQKSIFWETKFFAVLSDTTRVKVKYVAIKEGVNGLSRDSAVIYFLERTGQR